MRTILKAFGDRIKKFKKSNSPGELLIYLGLIIITITTLYVNFIVGCYILAVILILVGAISLFGGR